MLVDADRTSELAFRFAHPLADQRDWADHQGRFGRHPAFRNRGETLLSAWERRGELSRVGVRVGQGEGQDLDRFPKAHFLDREKNGILEGPKSFTLRSSLLLLSPISRSSPFCKVHRNNGVATLCNPSSKPTLHLEDCNDCRSQTVSEGNFRCIEDIDHDVIIGRSPEICKTSQALRHQDVFPAQSPRLQRSFSLLDEVENVTRSFSYRDSTALRLNMHCLLRLC